MLASAAASRQPQATRGNRRGAFDSTRFGAIFAAGERTSPAPVEVNIDAPCEPACGPAARGSTGAGIDRAAGGWASDIGFRLPAHRHDFLRHAVRMYRGMPVEARAAEELGFGSLHVPERRFVDVLTQPHPPIAAAQAAGVAPASADGRRCRGKRPTVRRCGASPVRCRRAAGPTPNGAVCGAKTGFGCRPASGSRRRRPAH